MTGDCSRSPNQVKNTVPLAQSTKSVEGKLWETLRLLAGTEANMHLFGTLKKLGLATNDVRHFVNKQTIHRKASKNIDFKLKKSAMQTKLGDACAYAKKLRQTKNILRNKVLQKYCDRQEGKKVVADLVNKYRVLKMDCMAKSERNYTRRYDNR